MTVRVQLRDGTQQNVDERTAADLFARGEVAAVNDGAQMPVVTDTGEIKNISAQDAAGAIAAGWQVINEDEAKRAELQRDYGGAAGMATSAASQLGLGAPAGVIGEISPEAGEYIRKARAANPGSSYAGMALDIALTELLTEGAATGANAARLGKAAELATTVGRAVTSPTRFMLRAGEAAENLAGRGVAGGIARGAVEGGIYSTAHAAGEAALGDPEMTAERIMSEGIFGAATGAALGGIMQGIGAAAKRGLEAAGPRISEAADSLATRKAIQALGGTKTQNMRVLSRGQEFTRDFARTVREDLPEAIGQKPGSLLNPEEIYEAAQANLKRAGDQFGEVEKLINAAGIRPDETRIFGAMQEVADGLKKSPITRGQGDAIQATIDSVKLEAGASTRDFQWWRSEIKSKLDAAAKAAYRQGALDNPVIQLASSVRTALREAADSASDQVAAQLGKPVGEAWRAVNRRYGIASEIEDMAANGRGRFLSNRTVGMSEQQGMIAGAVMGAAQGGLSGGLTGGFLLGAAQRIIKTYGDQWATTAANAIARNAGDVNAAIRQLAEKASVRVATTTARTLGGPVQAERAARSIATATREPSKDEQYKHAVIAAAHMQQPGAAEDYVAQVAPQLAMTAPTVAQTIANNIRAGSAVVLNKAQLPGGNAIKQTLPRPTPAARRAVLDAFDAVNGGPAAAIEAAREGRLSKDHLDALAVAHPKSTDEARTAIAQMLQDKQIPGKMRDQLRKFVGRPITEGDRPDVSARIQVALRISQQPPARMPMPKTTSSDTAATRYDRMET